MARVTQMNEDWIQVQDDNGSFHSILRSSVPFNFNVGDQVRVIPGNPITIRPFFESSQAGYYQQQDYSGAQQPYTNPNFNVNISLNAPPIGTRAYINKWIYLLLAFFLGAWGIHNFYAKRIIGGIFCILFFWSLIPWVIGLIKAIVILTMPSDSSGNLWY